MESNEIQPSPLANIQEDTFKLFESYYSPSQNLAPPTLASRTRGAKVFHSIYYLHGQRAAFVAHQTLIVALRIIQKRDQHTAAAQAQRRRSR